MAGQFYLSYLSPKRQYLLNTVANFEEAHTHCIRFGGIGGGLSDRQMDSAIAQ